MHYDYYFKALHFLMIRALRHYKDSLTFITNGTSFAFRVLLDEPLTHASSMGVRGMLKSNLVMFNFIREIKLCYKDPRRDLGLGVPIVRVNFCFHTNFSGMSRSDSFFMGSRAEIGNCSLLTLECGKILCLGVFTADSPTPMPCPAPQ